MTPTRRYRTRPAHPGTGATSTHVPTTVTASVRSNIHSGMLQRTSLCPAIETCRVRMSVPLRMAPVVSSTPAERLGCNASEDCKRTNRTSGVRRGYAPREAGIATTTTMVKRDRLRPEVGTPRNARPTTAGRIQEVASLVPSCAASTTEMIACARGQECRGPEASS